MSKLKFEPEMFTRELNSDALARITPWSLIVLSGLAQEIFDKWLSEQPVVYGHVKEGTPNFWGPKNSKFDDNHTARIIDIQPIEKPKCSHSNVIYNSVETNPRCNDCGKKLKATFEEIE